MALIPINQYAKNKGLHPSTIRKKINAGHFKATRLGRYWFIEEDEPWIDVHKKRCIRVEDGKVYNSYTDAAEEIGAHSQNVSSACRTGYSVKGYHFKYFEGSDLT